MRTEIRDGNTICYTDDDVLFSSTPLVSSPGTVDPLAVLVDIGTALGTITSTSTSTALRTALLNVRAAIDDALVGEVPA